MTPEQLIAEAEKAGVSAHYQDGSLYVCVDTATALRDAGYTGPIPPGVPATICLPPIPVQHYVEEAGKAAQSAAERFYAWMRKRLYGSKA